ncbi:MAG TPA: protease pro-enzyme activation domain-containing protein [Candidatus Acidoferrales bacterium]|nr:protease pro-enzyme activation domain-containing protein [Candidatus Acidoferrales bacterium]
MFRKLGLLCVPLVGLALLWVARFNSSVRAQSGGQAPILITQNIDESNLVTLKGNTRHEANAGNDRGQVADDVPMQHMLLQLSRSGEQEQALEQFIAQQQDPASPNYHHWLTAQQFGETFGLAQQDLDTITGWLGSYGFTVNVVYPSRILIDFSGTAGQVRQAFHTEIHYLDVNGAKHIANMRDPQIPAALASAVEGIVSLHDFLPHAMHQVRPKFTISSTGAYAVVPADLATIYNLNPVFGAGISGQGQTIVVIEDTNVFSTADWATFRSTLGLSGYSSGSFNQVHPAPTGGGSNCADPGVNGNDAEAILDGEYASAAAPSAAIELASCADTQTTFGGLIAVQNLINAGAPPAIISISYGECETQNGATANAAYNAAYQQAATEGVSVFVAAGDSGAAGCDPATPANPNPVATHGINVSGFASTPYNVAVGGTDFSDTYNNTNSTYWSPSNTSSFGSALSYIPETPWNDSCAGILLANHYTFTPEGLCNSIVSAFGGYNTTVAGGGGPSQCATGSPSTPGVVSGSCTGYPKPAWQSIVGNPSDGVRDIPDVSLFAANGLWSHYYIFCYSDVANGGAACGSDPSAWTGAGGTSFAAPILAGIQALVNQKVGGAQGNPDPVYYQLAAAEYGASGSASCNSNLGNGASASCTFYDVTLGDMVVNCSTGSPDCSTTTPGDSIGVLFDSTLGASAYGTTTGWDFASGIGSVNAYNLVNNWPVSTSPDFSLSATPSSLTIIQGSQGASTITINASNGFNGGVTFTNSALPSGVSAAYNPQPATASTAVTFTAAANAATGTTNVTVTGTSGALVHTVVISLTVNPPPDFTLSASPSSLTIVQGSNGKSTVTVNPLNGFNGSVTLSNSTLPTGVTVSYSSNPTSTSSTLTFSASSSATTGTTTVTITGKSPSLSHQTTISLTVNQPPPDFSLSAAPSSVTISQGGQGSSTLTVTQLNGFSSSVSFTNPALPSGVSLSFSPNPATTSTTATFSAISTSATGTTNVTVTGTGGGLSHSVTVSLTVNASGSPNFTLSASPGSLTIVRGAKGTSTITVNPQNGFSASVSLSASGLPKGVTAAFSPSSTTTTSTLTLTAGSKASTGTRTVTITGKSGGLTRKTAISLTVNP